MPLSPEVRTRRRSSICERRMAADVKAPKKDQGCALTANPTNVQLLSRRARFEELSQIMGVRIGMMNGLLSTKRACPILALKSEIDGGHSTSKH